MKASQILASAIFLVLAGLSISHAQTHWARSYQSAGSCRADVVLQTADNGFIVIGNIEDQDRCRFLIFKLNSEGMIKWQKIYRHPVFSQQAMCVKEAKSGYYVAGYATYDYPNKDVMLLKINNIGNIDWAKIYSCGGYSIIPSSLIITNEGQLAIAGRLEGIGNGDYFIMTLDLNGNIRDNNWAKAYGYRYLDSNIIRKTSDEALSIANFGGNGFLVGGNSSRDIMSFGFF